MTTEVNQSPWDGATRFLATDAVVTSASIAVAIAANMGAMGLVSRALGLTVWRGIGVSSLASGIGSTLGIEFGRAVSGGLFKTGLEADLNAWHCLTKSAWVSLQTAALLSGARYLIAPAIAQAAMSNVAYLRWPALRLQALFAGLRNMTHALRFSSKTAFGRFINEYCQEMAEEAEGRAAATIHPAFGVVTEIASATRPAGSIDARAVDARVVAMPSVFPISPIEVDVAPVSQSPQTPVFSFFPAFVASEKRPYAGLALGGGETHGLSFSSPSAPSTSHSATHFVGMLPLWVSVGLTPPPLRSVSDSRGFFQPDPGLYLRYLTDIDAFAQSSDILDPALGQRAVASSLRLPPLLGGRLRRALAEKGVVLPALPSARATIQHAIDDLAAWGRGETEPIQEAIFERRRRFAAVNGQNGKTLNGGYSDVEFWGDTLFTLQELALLSGPSRGEGEASQGKGRIEWLVSEDPIFGELGDLHSFQEAFQEETVVQGLASLLVSGEASIALGVETILSSLYTPHQFIALLPAVDRMAAYASSDAEHYRRLSPLLVDIVKYIDSRLRRNPDYLGNAEHALFGRAMVYAKYHKELYWIRRHFLCVSSVRDHSDKLQAFLMDHEAVAAAAHIPGFVGEMQAFLTWLEFQSAVFSDLIPYVRVALGGLS